MHIAIPKLVLDELTSSELATFNRTKSDIKGLQEISVDLMALDEDDLSTLAGGFERAEQLGARFKSSRQARIILGDMSMWKKVLTEGGAGQARPNTLRQFSDYLTEYIRTSPGHRVYNQVRGTNTWVGHYMSYVEYHAPTRDRHGYYQEAEVVVSLTHWELGHESGTQLHFKASDVDSRPVVEALAEKGYIIETDEMRQGYLRADAKFQDYFDAVGKAVNIVGYGTRLDDTFSSFGDNRIPMMVEGEPAVGVIDVVNNPDNDKDRFRPGSISHKPNFWASKNPKSLKSRGDAYDDLPGNMAINDGTGAVDDSGTMPEIPVHPFVMVYHLGRHSRYKVHVENLTDYEYDLNMGENLILPDKMKNLVNTLVGQGRVDFADIIEGKGSGICVLMGGPPGVGKTLTAEVFAQATQRPLLSVQAAQLGVSPDTIEKNLTSILRRGSRWNAVVLVDEADVYISKRGKDLTQNSIVAAFLRILERHTATIFLTTNYIEDVDDAVASRCIARLDYDMPDVAAQKSIWKVLNRLNGTGLSKAAINTITKTHNDLSGRDIKQLLKLASLWSANNNEPVTPQTIDYVRQFLSTRALVTAQ